MSDIYQERYLEHMERKQRTIAQANPSLLDILGTRRSQRIFNEQELAEGELAAIYEAVRLAPSSCNRQAILVHPVTNKGDHRTLEELLVGGRGWLHGAKVILLLFADMLAYKSPAEKNFMPYLDTGFVGENIYLAAEAVGIGACYVNPNIRPEDREAFHRQFNPRSLVFCGAAALGHYDTKAPEPPKRKMVFY